MLFTLPCSLCPPSGQVPGLLLLHREPGGRTQPEPRRSGRLDTAADTESRDQGHVEGGVQVSCSPGWHQQGLRVAARSNPPRTLWALRATGRRARPRRALGPRETPDPASLLPEAAPLQGAWVCCLIPACPLAHLPTPPSLPPLAVTAPCLCPSQWLWQPPYPVGPGKALPMSPGSWDRRSRLCRAHISFQGHSGLGPGTCILWSMKLKLLLTPSVPGLHSRAPSVTGRGATDTLTRLLHLTQSGHGSHVCFPGSRWLCNGRDGVSLCHCWSPGASTFV